MAESFDLDGARKAGYNDTEIADYLAGSRAFDISGARGAGYNDQEIIGHLSRPQMTQQSAGGEMNRVIGGQQMNQPAPMPIPQRPTPRPFYETPKPIPGTEKTGLPPVAPVRQPRVAYDAWGAMPGADERMQAIAGEPQPEAPPSLDIYGHPSSPLGDSAAVTGGRAVLTGLGGTVAGTGRGLQYEGRSAGPIVRAATAPIMGSGAGMEGIGKALEVAGNAITPPGQEGDDKYSKSWWKDPSLLTDPDYMAWQAGNAGGSMLAYMAPMVGALGRVTTAAGAVRGITAASSLAESLANSAEVYDKAKQNGASDEDALAAFQSNLPKDFVFTYLTNKAGLYNEHIRGAKLRTAIGTGLEVGQEVGQGVIGQHTLGKPLTEDLDVNALGGLLGGPVGGVMSPIGHAHAPQASPVGERTYQPPPQMQQQASAPQLQPIPSLDRPEEPVQPPVAKTPEAPVPLDAKTPAQLYEEAKRVAAGKATMGTTTIAKAVGVSQDEARAMLDQMAQEGIVAPVVLKGGGTQYVNVAKKAARGGRSLVTKAPKFEEMVAPQSATPETPREEVIQESGVAPEGSAMPPFESSPLIQQRKESFNQPDVDQIEQVNRDEAGDRESPALVESQQPGPAVEGISFETKPPTSKDSLEVQPPPPTSEKTSEVAQGRPGWTPKESPGETAGLSDRERGIEGTVSAKALESQPQLLAEYEKRHFVEGKPKVISSDSAAQIFPEYNQSKEARGQNRMAVHAAAQWLADKAYARALQAPPVGSVVFTGGGTGSGKSTVTREIQRAEIIYDTTLNSYDSAKDRIDAALATGRGVQIQFVHTDAQEAFKRSLSRATRIGRAVRMDYHEAVHRAARQTVLKLAEHYAPDSRVEFHFLDNTGDGPVPLKIDELRSKPYTGTSDELGRILDAEHKAGRVTPAIYEAVRPESVRQGREADKRGSAPVSPELAGSPGRSGVTSVASESAGTVNKSNKIDSNTSHSSTSSEAAKQEAPAAFTKELQAKLDEDTFVPTDREAELLDRVAKEAESKKTSGSTPFSQGFMGYQYLAHYAGRAANALKRRAAQRQQTPPQRQHYTPHDPEVKRQMEAARVEPEDKTSLRDLWDGLKAIWTRQYKHLAPGARFAPLRVEFNRVTKAKGNSVHNAAQAIVDQLGKLNKEEYSDFLYVVALDDLAARVRQQISEGQPVENSDLPFGLRTKADLYQARREARAVAAKNPAIVQALKLRRDMWSKIKPEYIAAMKAAGHDVAKTVSREDYFRHRVLEHLEMKNAIGNQGSGAGQRFKTPVGRGWLKKAMVNPHAYSLDYIRAEFEVLNQMMYDTARARFISWVADPTNKLNIADDLRKQAAAHNKKAALPAFQAMARNYNRQNPGAKSMTADSMYKRVMGSLNVGQRRQLLKKLAGSKYIGTLEKAYNEFALKTHAIYQPVEGHHFFLASALNDQMAEEIEKNGIGIVKSSEIRKVRAQGIKRPQLVLPREVIETMREFMQPPNSQFATAGEYVAKTLNAWKKLKLIHPVSVSAYNLRNASGDIWRVLEVAPRAFGFAKDSFKQIIKYKKTGHMSSPEFGAWWERGGMDSNQQVAEMGDVNKLEDLEHLLADPKAGAGKQALKAAGKAWNKVWGASRTFTDVREAILRFSMFREFQRQLKANGGLPYTFGASLREEVMALKDMDDRAYKLANDAMLAYDEVSRGGQFTRRYLIPFWSFQEQNARAYSRMVRNAVIDGRQAAAVGIVAMGGARAAAKVGAYTAVKVGQTVSMALALKTLTTLWNMAMSGDEEDDLPESVQKDTHLLFGRDANGKVRTFTRIGLIDDLLEWAGLNAAPFYVKEYLNGRMTIEEMAKEMGKAPLNKIAQGFTPMLKMPLELVTGRAVFPDVFSMRTIRDRGEYIARELGVLGLYKHLMGKPQPKMSAETIADMVIHRYDPNETHYNSFRYDLVPKWGVQHGKDKEEGGYGISRSSAALYDVRMSLRYGDQRALVKGLEAYTAAGGSRQNLQKAIDRLHPLGTLSKADRKAFVASLGPREKAQLEQAILFWKENFDTHRRELDREARGAGMIEKKKRTKKR